MVATWIEAPARGRLGGPVRAGMWSAVVLGTHPVEADQEVWLEISDDDMPLGPLPAYWLENKGVNSLWHVPIPPQPVDARIKYRSAARRAHSAEVVYSPFQELVVRPNLPDRTEATAGSVAGPEGLVGNRMMTVRVDGRGGGYDVYFPTVGLHSDVRPAFGDQPQSRSHFRSIVGGLAVGRRLDWFSERLGWEVFQHYQGATNLLLTELKWRHGPVRVLITDFAATGPELPRTAGGAVSPGQYIKRFRFQNDGPETLRARFGLYVHAEVNGGVGEPGLSWRDADRTLLATNGGHAHANRKLARDATIEFALALDRHGPVSCEPTAQNEAILLRPLELPPGEPVTVDLLVSGAFTGWRGDTGTFEHWLRPALDWFRSVDLDLVEQETAKSWDDFVEPLPSLRFPRTAYSVALRRSALAVALHADAQHGAIAAGFDRGLHAYCWPRDAVFAGGAMARLGHPDIGQGVLEWLDRARDKNRPYAYWCQKYSIDGVPEWETPAVDQTALIPWGLERQLRRTGDLDFVAARWGMVEQAAAVCDGGSGHPGLRWIDDLSLVASFGVWDNRFGAFQYSNACVVAGLRAAARLAVRLDRGEQAASWNALADRIWETGILRVNHPGDPGPGLVDGETGRFLDARRQSAVRGLWTDASDKTIDRSAATDISLLGITVPFGLLPASDPRVRATAEAILDQNGAAGAPGSLTRWGPGPAALSTGAAAPDLQRLDPSSLATLWMARYLIRLGRETGDAQAWTRAVGFLDEILGRLCPLGLALRSSTRLADEQGYRPNPAPSVWGLHAMLLETLLDLSSLDYDAEAKRLILEPVLPPAWPRIGISQTFACGSVDYLLERPPGSHAYRLALTSQLARPVALQVAVTCPTLRELGSWLSRPTSAAPRFDRANSCLSFTVELPAGESTCEWAWGMPAPGNGA